MALTYTDFTSYPLKITGITADYNTLISDIETFLVEDLEYTGEAADVSAILKYFVFFYFCQDAQTTVFAETGENRQLSKMTVPSIDKQVNAWDIGAAKLSDICEDNSTDAKEKYLKGYNFFI